MVQKSGKKQRSVLSRCNDKSGRDALVLEHLHLVKAIAIRVHESLPVHVDIDDLAHAGVLGLLDAATKFNPTANVAFSSYAKYRIRGAILDSLRRLDWASRDTRRRQKAIETATQQLFSELQRAPTEAEVAERVGISIERCREILVEVRNGGVVSMPARSDERDELPPADFASSEAAPEELCAHAEMNTFLGSAMKTLPVRHQMVVRLYYTKDLTMKKIGSLLGINESRVSQIHKAALEKLHSVLESNGICSAAAL